jgi:microsomal epoxide hydrolase
MTGFRPAGGPKTDEEIAWATGQGAATNAMGAYLRLQMTKPQSLAWLGAGNPVGQCAWIVERFYDWSDRKHHRFEENFTKDQLLTNVMIYVMTGSFATGAWYYRALPEEEGVRLKEGQRLETPTAFANFPGEALYRAPPRSYAARAYNVVRWSDQPSGGHFAAMEQPDLFVADVRAWAKEMAGV